MKITKKAFTLLELVLVIAIIWMLLTGTTIYLWWQWERAKRIEWQWCTQNINWEISNFLFSALTSKKIEINKKTYDPNYYYIYLASREIENKECNTKSEWYCSDLKFGYSDWEDYDYKSEIEYISEYKTINSKKTCKNISQGNKIFFSREWDNEKIIAINKWFSPNKNNIIENVFNIFKIEEKNTTATTATIISYFCTSSACNQKKEIAKFDIDSRSQTITLKKCKFYNSDDSTKCKERES